MEPSVRPSGSPLAGETLTVSTLDWAPEDASFTYQWLADGIAIEGATSDSLTLSAENVGSEISVEVTGTQDGYEATTVTSNATAPVAFKSFQNDAPTIAGEAVVFEALTASAGEWPEGTELSYQWIADGAVIDGATNDTLTLAPEQAGAEITVEVTAALKNYETTTLTSAPTAPVELKQFEAAAPTISGNPVLDETLTAETGEWPEGTELSYQWLADGAVINGETTETLTLTEELVGTKISVSVEASLDGYADKSLVSEPTAPVTLKQIAPGTPTISGIARIGETLTASPGEWPAGTELQARWLADGESIRKEKINELKLTEDLLGKQITVEFRATLPDHETSIVSSEPTNAVAAAPATHRLDGSDRYETAITASKIGYPEGSDVVYVATGLGYADALVAGPAAAAEGAPLLLTRPTTLKSEVQDEIQRLAPTKIVVVGGEGAVNNDVVSQLKSLVPNTVRRGGSDRYDTAAAVVSGAFDTATTAYVATGLDYPDALSASAVAAANDAPVLLVRGSADSAPEVTVETLTDLGVTTTIVTGGPAIVSDGITESLKPFGASREYGSDRFETNQKLNADLATSADQAYLATGFDYPDALAGAAIAGAQNAPLYLVRSTCVPAEIHHAIYDSPINHLSLLGGTGVLGKEIEDFRSC